MMTDLPPPQNVTNVKLLVVDDEPHIRAPLVRALSLIGYDVGEAASGREALALLEQSTYDLMILDILMPDLNGIEVMQRAHRKWPELLIIVLTGNASLESAIVALRSEVFVHSHDLAGHGDPIETIRTTRNDAAQTRILFFMNYVSVF